MSVYCDICKAELKCRRKCRRCGRLTCGYCMSYGLCNICFSLAVKDGSYKERTVSYTEANRRYTEAFFKAVESGNLNDPEIDKWYTIARDHPSNPNNKHTPSGAEDAEWKRGTGRGR